MSIIMGPSICDANCNLNCNGSLENQQTSPINGTYQVYYSGCWDVVYSGGWTYIRGLYPDNGTPDLYSTNCSTVNNRNLCVPANEMGVAPSFSGTGYAGIIGYIRNVNEPAKGEREYLQQELCHKMVQGQKYHVSFRAQLSDSSAFATPLGVMLMNNTLVQNLNAYAKPAVFDSFPPVYTTPSVVTNMTSWQLYSFDYTATSDHTTIAIGNFKNDSAQYISYQNNHVHREWVSATDIRHYFVAYYYIDSVNVVPINGIAQNISTLNLCQGQNATLNASLTNANANAVYNWTATPSDPSLSSWINSWNALHPTIPDTQVVVHPSVSTTYYVTVTDTFYNCTYLDTFYVNVASTTLDSLKGNTAKCDTLPRYVLYHHPTNSNLVYNWYTTTGDLVVGNGNDTVRVNWLGSLNLNSWLYVNVTDPVSGCVWKDSMYVASCCIAGAGPVFYNDTSSRVFGPNPGTISGVNFNINGAFWINQNLTFVGCNFNMGPNAKIIVSGGHTVLFQVDSLKAGCCAMWDGILVQSSTDTIKIEKFSYVGDAIRGIVSNNGGVYRVYNHVTFNRNYVSITVNPYSGTHGGRVQEAIFTSVNATYCSTPSGKLLAPYAGQWPLYGISATSVNSITFGNPTNALYFNTFTNLRNGIRTKYTNSSIYNNKFISVNKAATSKAIWCVGRYPTLSPLNFTQYNVTVGGTTLFQKNSFQDCSVGVYTDTAMGTTVINNRFNQTYAATPLTLRGVAVQVNNCTGVSRTVNIKQDSIFNHMIGIYLIQNNNSATSVTKNFITRTVNGTTTCTGIYQICNNNNTGTTIIDTNVITNVQYGIRVSGVLYLEIDRNLIYVRPTLFSAQAVKAIWAVSSFGIKIRVNQIYKENPTVTNTSPWVGGISVSACGKSIVTCNQINKIGYGLLFEGPGLQYATVFNNQLLSTYTGIWLKNGAVISPQGNAFVANDNIWSGAITNRLYTSGTILTFGPASRFYYRAGATYLPTPSNSGGLSVFIPSTLSSPQFQVICKYYFVQSITEYQQVAQGQVVYTGNEYAGQWLSRETLYRLLLDDSTGLVADTILANFKDSADVANLGKLTAALAVHSKGGLNSSSELTAAFSSIIGISPNDNLETNYQIVETIMLDHELNGGIFSNNELDALRNIAQLCPFTDGNAVYIARGLLAPIDSVEYESSCENGSSNRMAAPSVDTGSVFTFNLFPNPSTGSITLDYQLNESESGKLEIYSLAGSLITTIYLAHGQQLRTIMLPELGAGMYLYKVSVNGEMKLTDRLVIIK